MDPQYHSPLAEVRQVSQLRPGRQPQEKPATPGATERGSLRTALLELLSRRVEWTVYFEADFDTLYMDDIYAIETIQGCGAKLIWITPKMREEWRHKEQSPQRTL